MRKMPNRQLASIELIRPHWPAPSNVVAYSTTRKGGVSKPPYDSLNLGQHVGDVQDAVAHNRALLPNTESIVWLNQIHSDFCIEITPGCEQNQSADASICRTNELTCAVMGADCLPILLCDRQGKNIAAIHAGWRGLAAGIIENTLNKLNCDSGDLLVWLGPAISANFFEVGGEVRQAFGGYSEAFQSSHNPHKYLADLYKIARLKLAQQNINAIYGGEYCTFSQSERFFSHRRASQQGLENTGRMVTAIYLK